MDAFQMKLATFSVAGLGLASKQLDQNLKDQVVGVSRLVGASRELVQNNMIVLLSTLDPFSDSIPYLAILQVGIDHISLVNPANRSLILERMLGFLLTFNPSHVRYAGYQFRRILEFVLSAEAFPSTVAAEAVSFAMLRLDPTGSAFTSTHLALVRFAYEKSCIEQVLDVLGHDIITYPLTSGQRDKILCRPDTPLSSYISVDTGLTDKIDRAGVLEYNFLCGLCYTSIRDWANAHKAFARVITHPSRDKGVSEVMLSAYKRWALVGLLKNGKDTPCPAYTAPSAKGTYINLAAPYQSIAHLFEAGNVEQLRGEIETNRTVWEEDGTTTLIEAVAAAYQKWQILNSRTAYQQISISELRKTTLSAETGESLSTDAEVLDLVRGMIESNMLRGTLQQEGETTYLAFLDDDSALSEADFAREVARYQNSILSLSKQYKAVDERLAGSKEYVRYLVREQKRSEKEAIDPGLGFDHAIEDEDLMTGILNTE